MKHSGPICALLFALVLSVGCGNSAQNENDAIREGINEHLATVKSINMSAMDMNVTSVSIQDNKAQAQVNFLPKGAAPGAAGMQVSYSLEKQNGKWAVVDALPTGGLGQHPLPGQSPDGTGNSTPGSVPDFSNLLHGQTPSGSGLPPGHPPLNSQGGAASPTTAGSPH
jgi:hypothetical protein